MVMEIFTDGSLTRYTSVNYIFSDDLTIKKLLTKPINPYLLAKQESFYTK
jgi:hypothetical protein